MKKLRFIICVAFFMYSLFALTACGKKPVVVETVSENTVENYPQAATLDADFGDDSDIISQQQINNSNSYFNDSQNIVDKTIEDEMCESERCYDTDGDEALNGGDVYYSLTGEELNEKLENLGYEDRGGMYKADTIARTLDIYTHSYDHNNNYVISPYSVYNSMNVILLLTIDKYGYNYRQAMAKWFENSERPESPDYINAATKIFDTKFKSQNAYVFTNFIGTNHEFAARYATNELRFNSFNTYNTEFETEIGNTYGNLNNTIKDFNPYIVFNDNYDISDTYCASIGAFNASYANEATYYVTGEKFNDNTDCYFAHFNEELKYCETDAAQICVKPFTTDSYSIAFILPKSNINSYISNSFYNDYYELLISLIDAEDNACHDPDCDDTNHHHNEKMLSLYVPVFRTTSETCMDSDIKANGMSGLYDRSGNTGVMQLAFKDGGSPIDTITHCSYFALNGRGARSYNDISVEKTIDQIEVEDGSIDFKLDKPFVYVIFDNDTGIPVMIGNVMTME